VITEPTQTFKINLSHFIEFNWPETEFIVLLGGIHLRLFHVYIQTSTISTGADT
jgi:hypothetical protein